MIRRLSSTLSCNKTLVTNFFFFKVLICLCYECKISNVQYDFTATSCHTILQWYNILMWTNVFKTVYFISTVIPQLCKYDKNTMIKIQYVNGTSTCCTPSCLPKYASSGSVYARRSQGTHSTLIVTIKIHIQAAMCIFYFWFSCLLTTL